MLFFFHLNCLFVFLIIKRFLRQDTGLDYEIHIIEESAARDFILSTEESQGHHDRSAPGQDDPHLPLSYVSSLFAFHFSATWKVGYMMNCSGDYNGKMSNYESNLLYFKSY